MSNYENKGGNIVPTEVERKFLIEYPDISYLESEFDCAKWEIVQTYLSSDNKQEVRVRHKIENGKSTYIKTIKKKITDVTRIEIETNIKESEYQNLLKDSDPNKKPIVKTRYRIIYNNQLFEIDIYPFWDDKAVMEIELKSEEDVVDFPKNINIIEEVTGKEEYSNSYLAKIEK